MTFLTPSYLFLLLLLLPAIFWYIRKLGKSDASLQISSVEPFKGAKGSWRIALRHVPFVLLCCGFAALVIALARPQTKFSWNKQSTEGIDIMVALDISGTMQAEDLKPNRLEAAKTIASEFVMARPNDNIGLVVFAGESFTQCPLTTDHNVLVNLFNAVKFGMIEDGTAIGLGIANAVNRMKDSPTKSKIIILLTDGSNNRGDISPQTAAEIAQTYGIRIYAIGVGAYGQVRMPVQGPFGKEYITMDSEFDEKTLTQVANTTGGEYFRATDNKTLREIYQQIDQLEKTKIHVNEFSKRNEAYEMFAAIAAVCVFLMLFLKNFVLKSLTN